MEQKYVPASDTIRNTPMGILVETEKKEMKRKSSLKEQVFSAWTG